jgi:hypothetical protein
MAESVRLSVPSAGGAEAGDGGSAVVPVAHGRSPPPAAATGARSRGGRVS